MRPQQLNVNPSENEELNANPYRSPVRIESADDREGMRLLDLYVPLVLSITVSGTTYGVVNAVYTALTVSWRGVFRDDPSEFLAMALFYAIVGSFLAFCVSLVLVGCVLAVVRVFTRTLFNERVVYGIGAVTGGCSAWGCVNLISGLEAMSLLIPVLIGATGGAAGGGWAIHLFQKRKVQLDS